MKRMMILIALFASMIVVLQISNVYAPSITGGWITGGGTIGSGSELASFGGLATKMRSGAIEGHWVHVESGGQNSLRGDVRYLYFHTSGMAEFGGTGTFNGVSGYTFGVTFYEGFYTIEIRDPANIVVFEAEGSLSSGNIMVHAPNNGHPY